MREVWLDGQLVGQAEGGVFYPLRPLSDSDRARAEALARGESTTETGETDDGAADLPA